MTNASASETSNTRLGLRVFGVLLAVSAMSVFGALWRSEAWVYYIILAIPGTWSLVNAILIVLKRPVHPGAHIALDLIITVVQLFFGFFGLFGASMHYRGGISWASQRIMAIAALSLLIVNGLVHLVHFVLGCCDVHWRRHASDYIHKGDIRDST